MKRLIYIILLTTLGHVAGAQKKSDTLAVIRDFDQVMSFAVQPYLYYASITTVSTNPAILSDNTSKTIQSNFYKLNNDLYYGNDQEETYLQDSLLIRINHFRKSILINKVDTTSKEKLNILPLQKTDVQKALREHYQVSRVPGSGDTAGILLRQQESAGMKKTTAMFLAYSKSTGLPYHMDITVYTNQSVSEEEINVLNKQGLDAAKFIQDRDGVHYLVMSQTVSMHFSNIDNTKAKAIKMPLWTEKIAFDDSQKTYKGKGMCEGYDLSQTF